MPDYLAFNTPRSARGANASATLVSLVLIGLGVIAVVCFTQTNPVLAAILAIPLIIVGVLTPMSMKMAAQWERAIVLRLGRFHRVAGPGLFFVVPFIDAAGVWLDQRIQTTEFNAERALTKDTVPVDVDAVVFWQIHDPERAALEIADYLSAIARVAQTSLREMVGSFLLSTLLSDRERGDAALRDVIGAKTAEWGVTAHSVEIRDIVVPDALQDAMSREAQAQREAAARQHLGEAEKLVAKAFVEAAEIYAKSPAAMQLRAMNIIYETTKERGATILMPTAMVDAMNPAVAVALTQATKA